MPEDDLKKLAQKSSRQEMKPWEQRSGPGMGGGSGQSDSSHGEQPEKFERAGGLIEPWQLESVIDCQTDLVHLPRYGSKPEGRV
jgi:hypothetical protein